MPIAGSWALLCNENNLILLKVYFIPPDSSQRGAGTSCKMALPSVFWVQGEGLLQRGLNDAKGLKEHCGAPLRQSIGILGFSVFPILGSLQSNSVMIYVALGDGRRHGTYGSEAVNQEMRPNDVFEVLAPLRKEYLRGDKGPL